MKRSNSVQASYLVIGLDPIKCIVCLVHISLIIKKKERKEGNSEIESQVFFFIIMEIESQVCTRLSTYLK